MGKQGFGQSISLTAKEKELVSNTDQNFHLWDISMESVRWENVIREDNFFLPCWVRDAEKKPTQQLDVGKDHRGYL